MTLKSVGSIDASILLLVVGQGVGGGGEGGFDEGKLTTGLWGVW